MQEPGDDMVAVGADLIDEACESLLRRERAMLGGDAVVEVLVKMRSRVLELAEEARHCGDSRRPHHGRNAGSGAGVGAGGSEELQAAR